MSSAPSSTETGFNPVTQPVRPQTGHLTVKVELWTADPDGSLRDDITDALVSGRTEHIWNEAVAIPGTLDVTVRGHDVVEAIKDCLIPIVTTEWEDRYGHWYQVRERLGLFFYLPPDRDYNRTEQTNIISGMDATWALDQMTLGRQFVIEPGNQFLGLWAREMFLSGGQTRLRTNLPQTSIRPEKKTTHKPNDNVRKAINDLYVRAGYWPVVPDRQGMLTTSPRLVAGKEAPSRFIRSRQYDVMIPESIKFRPDRSAFFNEVSLASNNPEDSLELLDGYKATLSDPNSPYSRQNLGIVIAAEPVMDDRSETRDVMRNRVLSMLEHSTSMPARWVVSVMPDPRVSPREVWDVDIEQDNGRTIVKGPCRVESVAFGFAPNAAAQVCTIAQLADVGSID